MERRLVEVIVWLVVLVFVGNQAPSAGQGAGSKKEARVEQANQLAAKLVAAVPGILEQFRTRRRELLAHSGGVPQAGVVALLDSTETSLQKEIKGPDFVPLRDHIADVFKNARNGLGLPVKTALRSSPAPQATLASLGRGLTDGVLKNVVEAFLEDLYAKATKKELTVDLCVLSDPPNAKFSLHAAGGEEIDPTKTNGRIEKLFRGNYFYTVDRPPLPKIGCGSPTGCQLKLYSKSKPALSCDWGNGNGACYVQDGWPEACRRGFP